MHVVCKDVDACYMWIRIKSGPASCYYCQPRLGFVLQVKPNAPTSQKMENSAEIGIFSWQTELRVLTGSANSHATITNTPKCGFQVFHLMESGSKIYFLLML